MKFSHKRGKVVYGGWEDYFYCSWEFLSGQSYDAWGIRMYYVPGKYLTILDHWGRGLITHPQTYKWFVEERIEAGDRSPYDYYFGLPAPWLKVRYNYVSGTHRVTYNCALDLFVKGLEIFNTPIYFKTKTVTSSFDLFVLGPSVSSPAVPVSTPSRNHMEDYITFTFPEISYIKKTIVETLMFSKHRPDFIIVETKKVGNKELLILTGYERHRNNKIEVIFKQSKEIAVKNDIR